MTIAGLRGPRVLDGQDPQAVLREGLVLELAVVLYISIV